MSIQPIIPAYELASRVARCRWLMQIIRSENHSRNAIIIIPCVVWDRTSPPTIWMRKIKKHNLDEVAGSGGIYF